MKQKLLAVCLLAAAAAILVIYFFKVPVSNLLTFGLFLLCPLLHIFMMKNHKH